MGKFNGREQSEERTCGVKRRSEDRRDSLSSFSLPPPLSPTCCNILNLSYLTSRSLVALGYIHTAPRPVQLVRCAHIRAHHTEIRVRYRAHRIHLSNTYTRQNSHTFVKNEITKAKKNNNKKIKAPIERTHCCGVQHAFCTLDDFIAIAMNRYKHSADARAKKNVIIKKFGVTFDQHFR